MRARRDKDTATASNQGDIHEFVIAEIRGEDSFYFNREAASLTDLRQACAAAGKSSEFHGHCVFEELLRNQHFQKLADLDADDSFADDADESSEYKRGYAKYLVRDLNEALFIGREQLAALSVKNDCN